jgi:2-C-methyl-D-erythritol 4-phosphate cytidylyltransferase
MAVFAVVVTTAAPPGISGESGGGPAMAKLDGREVLLKTVELFVNRENVKQIRVVFQPSFAEEAKQKFGSHFSFSGIKISAGGARWIDQIAAAAPQIPPEATHIIIHDAARPAVPYTDIEAIMEAAEKHPAVALAAAVRSTLIEVDEGGNGRAYHLPSEYMQLLTPQIYRRDKFTQMANSKTEVHASELMLIKGSPLNVRMGGGHDASLVKAMLNMMPKAKTKALSPFEEAQW